MRTLSLLIATAALGGCTMAAEPVGRSPRAEAHLQQLLAGRTAGPPQSCLHTLRANNMITIDDNTVVYRDGSTMFRNDFQGTTCSRLGTGSYALLTRSSGSSLCRGDIAEVADLRSGVTVGSCVVGDFVPYRLVR